MWRSILMISGYAFVLLGLAMLIPAGVDLYYTNATSSPFMSSAFIAVICGLIIFFVSKTKISQISIKEGYLITFFSWLSFALMATFPLLMYKSIDGVANNIFEAVSGITSTGASILTNVEAQPKAVLMWRSILNAVGGIGVVVFAITMLPFLGIGGMQIFQRESSDNDKFMPKISYITKRILFIYVGLMFLCAVSYHFFGMNWFDAVNHALTTVSTGGFSTKNNSFGFFNSFKMESVAILFMISGALPLSFYFTLGRNSSASSLKREQVKAFLSILLIYILCMTIYLRLGEEYSLTEALRYSAFNIVSVTTSTGFSSVNYILWGSFAALAFSLFALTGGCTGSTSGSVKIFRWQVLFAFIKKRISLLSEPYRVTESKIGNSVIEAPLVESVLFFLSAYVITLICLVVLVSLSGLDFATSISATIACLTNSGPGATLQIGPFGSYAALPDGAKIILSVAMLIGRLEVLTIFALFTRNFWQE